MDNSLFAVNYLTFVPGVDLAYVAYGITIQVEATLFELLRVRGSSVSPDSNVTNFTCGTFVGYYLVPPLSVGTELRYQRLLTTPAAVSKDPN
jgi:hypothetical protein